MEKSMITYKEILPVEYEVLFTQGETGYFSCQEKWKVGLCQ
jgi:hypothetical protein